MYAIEVDSISKSFSGRNILKGISFKVKEGEIHGFLGPNGAGKTTTMRVLAKLCNLDAGNIKVLDKELEKQGTDYFSQVGFLLETPPLYDDMTVERYLSYVLKLKLPKLDKDTHQRLLADVINKLELQQVNKRLISNLSRGYKQRVGVAQAIIHRPKIVILDEPTIGLDPQAIIKMRELIDSLRGEFTVLLSSHLLHEMSLVCDTISIINDGEIAYSGSLSELKSSSFSRERIIIESNIQEIEKVISNFDSGLEVESKNEKTYVSGQLDKSSKGSLLRELVAKGDVFEYRTLHSSLEEVFLNVTERSR